MEEEIFDELSPPYSPVAWPDSPEPAKDETATEPTTTNTDPTNEHSDNGKSKATCNKIEENDGTTTVTARKTSESKSPFCSSSPSPIKNASIQLEVETERSEGVAHNNTGDDECVTRQSCTVAKSKPDGLKVADKSAEDDFNDHKSVSTTHHTSSSIANPNANAIPLVNTAEDKDFQDAKCATLTPRKPCIPATQKLKPDLNSTLNEIKDDELLVPRNLLLPRKTYSRAKREPDILPALDTSEDDGFYLKSRFGRTRKPKTFSDDFVVFDGSFWSLGVVPGSPRAGLGSAGSPRAGLGSAGTPKTSPKSSASDKRSPKCSLLKFKDTSPKKSRAKNIPVVGSVESVLPVVAAETSSVAVDEIDVFNVGKLIGDPVGGSIEFAIQAVPVKTNCVARDDNDSIKLEDCDWLIGDLAWARIGGHPYWPCIVSPDPILGVYYKKNKSRRTFSYETLVHVYFFGDKGRHSWVNSSLMMVLEAPDTFNRLLSNTCDRKYTMNPTKNPKLELGISEAEQVVEKPVALRMDTYFEFYPNAKPQFPSTARRSVGDRKSLCSSSATEADGGCAAEVFDNECATVGGKRRASNRKSKTLPEVIVVSDTVVEGVAPIEKRSPRAVKNGRLGLIGSLADRIAMRKATSPRSLRPKRKSVVCDSDSESSIVPQVTASLRSSSNADTGSVTSSNSEAIKKKPRKLFKRKCSVNDAESESVTSSCSDAMKVSRQLLKRKLPLNGKDVGIKRTKVRSDSPYCGSEASKTDVNGNLAAKLMKKTKRMLKKMGPGFEEYRDKLMDRMSDEQPELSSAEVERYLQTKWLEMSNAQKAKYRPRVAVAKTDDSESSDSSTSEESENTDVAIINAFEMGRKKLGLFNNNRNEKVCFICETAGSKPPVKCKGPCSEMFHVDCLKPRESVPKPGAEQSIKSSDILSEDADKPDADNSDTADLDADCKVISKTKIKNGSRNSRKSILKEKDVLSVKENRTAKLDMNIKLEPMETDDSDNVVQQKSTATKVEGKEENKSVDNLADSFDSDDEPLMSLKEAILRKADQGCSSSSQSESIELNGTKTAISQDECRKIDSDSGEEFRCNDCREGKAPSCFVCRKDKCPETGQEERKCCSIGKCSKYYHLDCLKVWPQAQCNVRESHGRRTKTTTTLNCPLHSCHTCISDDPRNNTSRTTNDRVLKCIRCPTAYHYANHCVAAGTEVLNATQMICPKHYKRKNGSHFNASWCFICAMGGSLICCETCPTSFHAECLSISPPEGSFTCEDCETGRLPLHGECVWVKLGNYRWWPAQILFPGQIPDNIMNLAHARGQFAVKFFGSHDHYWVSRGRVFLYQEGDTGPKHKTGTKTDEVFRKAIAEVTLMHSKLNNEKASRESAPKPGLKPPRFVKIKTNKLIGNVRLAECDPSQLSPCHCDPHADDPCGPDSECINRMLLVECHPKVCPAAERCNNRQFEKRQYPPVAPNKTSGKGWGLYTLADLKEGDFIIEYVGEMIDESEFRRRLNKKHDEKDENFYFLTLDKDRLLDAGPRGNISRFMNHSCQPNCETQKWNVNNDTRIGIFALRDIAAHTELTFNYNLECTGTDKKACLCGAPNCSGFIGLKVNRQPAADEASKTERRQLAAARKKQKRKRRRLQSATAAAVAGEDTCFLCGDGGDLLLCDNKTCPKGYHLDCLRLKNWPDGKWLCPWHRCNVCDKRTLRRCGFCLNSYCEKHAEDNIFLDPIHGMVCSKHNNSVTKDVETEDNDVANNDSNDGNKRSRFTEDGDAKSQSTMKRLAMPSMEILKKVIGITDLKSLIRDDVSENSCDVGSVSRKRGRAGSRQGSVEGAAVKVKQVKLPKPASRGERRSMRLGSKEVLLEDLCLPDGTSSAVGEANLSVMAHNGNEDLGTLMMTIKQEKTENNEESLDNLPADSNLELEFPNYSVQDVSPGGTDVKDSDVAIANDSPTRKSINKLKAASHQSCSTTKKGRGRPRKSQRSIDNQEAAIKDYGGHHSVEELSSSVMNHTAQEQIDTTSVAFKEDGPEVVKDVIVALKEDVSKVTEEALTKNSPTMSREDNVTLTEDDQKITEEGNALIKNNPNLPGDGNVTLSDDDSNVTEINASITTEDPNVTEDDNVALPEADSKVTGDNNFAMTAEDSSVTEEDSVALTEHDPKVPREDNVAITTEDDNVALPEDDRKVTGEDNVSLSAKDPNVTEDNNVAITDDNPKVTREDNIAIVEVDGKEKKDDNVTLTKNSCTVTEDDGVASSVKVVNDNGSVGEASSGNFERPVQFVRGGLKSPTVPVSRRGRSRKYSIDKKEVTPVNNVEPSGPVDGVVVLSSCTDNEVSSVTVVDDDVQGSVYKVDECFTSNEAVINVKVESPKSSAIKTIQRGKLHNSKGCVENQDLAVADSIKSSNSIKELNPNVVKSVTLQEDDLSVTVEDNVALLDNDSKERVDYNVTLTKNTFTVTEDNGVASSVKVVNDIASVGEASGENFERARDPIVKLVCGGIKSPTVPSTRRGRSRKYSIDSKEVTTVNNVESPGSVGGLSSCSDKEVSGVTGAVDVRGSGCKVVALTQVDECFTSDEAHGNATVESPKSCVIKTRQIGRSRKSKFSDQDKVIEDSNEPSNSIEELNPTVVNSVALPENDAKVTEEDNVALLEDDPRGRNDDIVTQNSSTVSEDSCVVSSVNAVDDIESIGEPSSENFERPRDRIIKLVSDGIKSPTVPFTRRGRSRKYSIDNKEVNKVNNVESSGPLDEVVVLRSCTDNEVSAVTLADDAQGSGCKVVMLTSVDDCFTSNEAAVNAKDESSKSSAIKAKQRGGRPRKSTCSFDNQGKVVEDSNEPSNSIEELNPNKVNSIKLPEDDTKVTGEDVALTAKDPSITDDDNVALPADDPKVTGEDNIATVEDDPKERIDDNVTLAKNTSTVTEDSGVISSVNVVNDIESIGEPSSGNFERPRDPITKFVRGAIKSPTVPSTRRGRPRKCSINDKEIIAINNVESCGPVNAVVVSSSCTDNDVSGVTLADDVQGSGCKVFVSTKVDEYFSSSEAVINVKIESPKSSVIRKRQRGRLPQSKCSVDNQDKAVDDSNSIEELNSSMSHILQEDTDTVVLAETSPKIDNVTLTTECDPRVTEKDFVPMVKPVEKNYPIVTASSKSIELSKYLVIKFERCDAMLSTATVKGGLTPSVDNHAETTKNIVNHDSCDLVDASISCIDKEESSVAIANDTKGLEDNAGVLTPVNQFLTTGETLGKSKIVGLRSRTTRTRQQTTPRRSKCAILEEDVTAEEAECQDTSNSSRDLSVVLKEDKPKVPYDKVIVPVVNGNAHIESTSCENLESLKSPIMKSGNVTSPTEIVKRRGRSCKRSFAGQEAVANKLECKKPCDPVDELGSSGVLSASKKKKHKVTIPDADDKTEDNGEDLLVSQFDQINSADSSLKSQNKRKNNLRFSCKKKVNNSRNFSVGVKDLDGVSGQNNGVDFSDDDHLKSNKEAGVSRKFRVSSNLRSNLLKSKLDSKMVNGDNLGLDSSVVNGELGNVVASNLKGRSRPKENNDTTDKSYGGIVKKSKLLPVEC